MPVARFEMPDGRIGRFKVPDGTTPEQAQALISQHLETPQPKTAMDTAVDKGNALGTGYFRGMTRIAGLPVDTVANVIDLGKAALGAPYIAATGKAPPEWLQVQDRGEVIGSGENLIRNATKTAAGRMMLNPSNPEEEGGTAQAIGGGLNAVMAPNTALQATNQALIGALSTVAGKTVYEQTGDPALAIAAAMSPSGIQQGATAATKYAVRGGEAGRQQMQQRVQDLKNAGVDKPTLGLASNNKLIGGVENLLQSTPGAVNIMGRARDAAVEGLRSKAESAADLASTNRGALEAGTAIQGGIRNFKDQFKDTQGSLYDALGNRLSPRYPTDIVRTRETLAALNSDIPGAPALSKFFKNEKVQALDAALNSDTAITLPGPNRPVATGGIMNRPVEGPPTKAVSDTLPFEAVKKTRTLVGNEIADNSLLSQVPQSKWRALYGGISEDLKNTANRAGPEAAQAFNRASNYTRAGSQRLERVAPFAQTTAPEQAFTALVNASRENVSTLQAVKKTLPDGARGQVAGTIIERLGRANNGVQNESGTAWSPETFLTNWNKMTPKARNELFSGFPNATEVKNSVDAVAKATSMMRENSKMWANPSGTAANLMARGTIGLLGAGGGAALTGLLNPMVPLGAAVGLLGSNRLAAGLTSQNVVNGMLNRNYVSPEMLNAQALSLIAPGLLSGE